jgi:hypothetical protein
MGVSQVVSFTLSSALDLIAAPGKTITVILYSHTALFINSSPLQVR